MSRITLANAQFAFLNQGAIIQEISVAGHNVVLSFPTARPYLKAPYFGETIGRVANRIPNGKIDHLNGRVLQLPLNERGINHLHGGIDGWGHKEFSGPDTTVRAGKEAVRYTYTSPDGDQGYPGTVTLDVFYMAYEVLEDNITKSVLEIEYEATFVGTECDETAVNITNHSYFNIGGGPSLEDTELTLSTTQYLPVDVNAIPTGEISAFPGIEAGKPFVLGAKEPSIDHCFVLTSDTEDLSIDTRNHEAKILVRSFHPATKIHFDVYSTEPAFQLYTGDFIDVAATEHGPALGPRSGMCIEPSRFINAVNVPEWRPQVCLKQGQTYGSRIIYKMWKD